MNTILAKFLEGPPTFYIDGEQVNSLDLVIVEVKPMERTYWGRGHRVDKESKTYSPLCWAADTTRPEPTSYKPQSTRCIDCPQNVQGSGSHNTKACKFSQRLTVAVPPFGAPFLFKVNGSSLFTQNQGGGFNLRNYTKHLEENDEKLDSVLTHAFFSSHGRGAVVFKPVRSLTEDEIEEVQKLQHPPNELIN